MTTTIEGRYVPPHLRQRRPPPSSSPIAGPSRTSVAAQNTTAAPRHSRLAPNRSESRTPWAASAPSPSPSRISTSRDTSPRRALAASSTPAGRIHSVAPTLHVYGDSFVGPLKLLTEDCVRINSFKGASAKGLNNPNSLKQVSRDLLPAVNSLLAPPPYAYTPSSGRWALFIFGNVDLQINYLWQLQYKPISALSFPAKDTLSLSLEATDGMDTDTEDAQDGALAPRSASSVLASATETSLKGPALGPELFVEAILKAYTSFLERAIVNGPVGERIRNQAPPENVRRAPPPGKVLIAAALPPLVEDEVLSRIPEKYVERLEGDHEKAQKAMRRSSDGGSRTPWAKGSPVVKSEEGPDDVEMGLSTLAVTDAPGSPHSTSSSLSRTSSTFDAHQMESSLASVLTSPSDPSTSRSGKTPISNLLAHDPPLCTLPVRIRMTDVYNAGLASFCAKHPDILGFVDVSPAMRPVDRAMWACPVDPTNIHPLWEPTLPLWLKALAENGVPTEGYSITKDAEETLKAYELDKKRRTEKRDGEWAEERLKLRDD